MISRVFAAISLALAATVAAHATPPIAIDDTYSHDAERIFGNAGPWAQDFYNLTPGSTASLPNSHMAFTWRTGSEVRVLTRDTATNQTAPEFVITQFASGDPSITGLTSGDIVVAWSGANSSISASEPDIFIRRYGPGLSPLGGPQPVNTVTPGDQTAAYVTALNGGGFAVAWTTPTDYRARFYDADGDPVSGEVTLNTNAVDGTVFLDARALDDGGAVFAWTNGDTEVRTRSFSAGGTAISSERSVMSAIPALQQQNRALLDNGGVIFASLAFVGEGADRQVQVEMFDARGNQTLAATAVGPVRGFPNTFGSIDLAALNDGGFTIVLGSSTTRFNTGIWQAFAYDHAGNWLRPVRSGGDRNDNRLIPLEDGRFILQFYGGPAIYLGQVGVVYFPQPLSTGYTHTLNVRSNDRDEDGDSLVITAINGQTTADGVMLASGATVTLADGALVYDASFTEFATDPAPGQAVSDSFTYTVSDPDGAVSTATVTLNLVGFEGFELGVATQGLGTGTVTSINNFIDCGSGNTDCSRKFERGTSIELFATPASGSTFDGWSGDCTGTGQCIVPMTAARSVTARFEVSSPPEGRIVASTLPGARSGYVGGPVLTAYMTVISRATTPAQDCRISVAGGAPFTFGYQALGGSNQPTGPANPRFDLGNGQSMSFVLAMDPQTATGASGYTVQPQIACDNADLAPIPGVNSVLVSIGNAPVPDILSIGATLSGDGVVRIPSSGNRISFMSAAAVNIGAGDGSAGADEATMTVSVDTGAAVLPVTLEVCETNSGGACVTPRGETALTTVFSGSTAKTFAVFVRANEGATIPFDPANARVYLRFTDATGTVRSVTSAAISAPAE